MKKLEFAVSRDGKSLFMKEKHCGIAPLALSIGEVTITFFYKQNTEYIEVREAIAWHEKELRKTNGKATGSEKSLRVLRDALDRFESGTLEFDP